MHAFCLLVLSYNNNRRIGFLRPVTESLPFYNLIGGCRDTNEVTRH